MAVVASVLMFLLVVPLLTIVIVPISAMVVSAFDILGSAVWRRTGRHVTQTLLCPVTGWVVTVDFLVPLGENRSVDVGACTAFEKPRSVTCRKECLHLMKAA